MILSTDNEIKILCTFLKQSIWKHVYQNENNQNKNYDLKITITLDFLIQYLTCNTF